MQRHERCAKYGVTQAINRVIKPAAVRTQSREKRLPPVCGRAMACLGFAKIQIGRLLLPGLLLLACLAAAADSTNSPWIAHVWQSDDGLPNNNITGLAQTPDGYLWIATPSSRLTRFDGVQFDVFTSRSIVPGHEERITRLLRSRDGSLWLAMDHGPIACLKNGTTQVFSNNLPDQAAETMTEDAEGAIWVTYRGGFGYRIKQGVGTLFTTNAVSGKDGFSSLASDGKGRLWCGNSEFLSVLHNGHFETNAQPGGAGMCLASARDGDIWICWRSQLAKFDGENIKIVGTYTPENPDAVPTVLLEDHRGGVWVGTSDSGLFHYNGSGFERVSTSHPKILSLLEDVEGNIWVGTGGGGLNRIQPRAVMLEGTESGLPFVALQSICEDAGGTMWGVTQNHLLVTRTNGRWSTVSTNEGWPGGSATCVTADRTGAIWIGTANHKLYRRSEDHFTTFATTDGLATRHIIHCLLASSTGDVWIGSSEPGGLQCLRSGHFINFNLPPDFGIIRAMTEDASGNVWVGSTKGALLRILDDKINDLSTNLSGSAMSIRTLYATPDGSRWIGYAGSGLGRLKKGVFTRVTTQQGLFDDDVSQIVADGQGWLWIGADHGIFKIREQDFDDLEAGRTTQLRSVHYGESVGLSSLQANYDFSPGSLRSRDGRIWMPMLSALAVVDPSKLIEEAKAPSVILKRVAVDDQTVALYGGVLPVGQAVDTQRRQAPLRIHPGHSRLEFEFTALSFRAPENMEFSYQLEGYDNGWNDAGTQRQASYSRLPAGDYRFRVKACNGDGVWNESGTTFAFTVTPFFWQTWWFRLASLAMFTSIVLVTTRIIASRRMRRHLQEIERQAALNKLRMAEMEEMVASRTHELQLANEKLKIEMAERAQTEEILRQSQKMEAFGQLAAGVAHDFNNILTVIQGYLALLQSGQLSKEEQSSAIGQSIASADRAANLTRQLLTFGRRQIMRYVDLDLNEVVANTTKMLKRLVGEQIVLETCFAPGSALVYADLGMMEQVLMNLAINSRDAMPKGGRLVFQTMATDVSEDDVRLKPRARPGQFIRLSVSDTGCGIAPKHLSHIFEPFFTTKEIGKGTGLGLATVFGIIEQHRGWIEVQTEQDKGTTFHMFVPRLTQTKEQKLDGLGFQSWESTGVASACFSEVKPCVEHSSAARIG
jgi:signal transduction histidine kinase/ligand-binding sensor domain-containing protein